MGLSEFDGIAFISATLPVELCAKKRRLAPPVCTAFLNVLFLVYQIDPVHYAKFARLSCQWNEWFANYFRLGLLTGRGQWSSRSDNLSAWVAAITVAPDRFGSGL
jgi:hypothetical protein